MKRVLSAILSIVLAVGLTPLPAFADMAFTATSGATGVMLSPDNTGYDWSIDSDFNLVISGTDAKLNWDYAPWRDQMSNVKTITVRGNVKSALRPFLFYGYMNLTSADLSGLDTSESTDMEGLFYDCNKLTSLNLSGLNTSNVASMKEMFWNCNKLRTLDLSSFDTRNVRSMQDMFGACSELESVDLSSFDTSNVTNMSNMFSGCYSLVSLDVSKFDTGKVEDMSAMFNHDESLKALDVSNFDLGSARSAESMFCSCASLEELALPRSGGAKLESLASMFSNCGLLKSVDMSGIDTANVTDMSNMFQSCRGFEDLDLSGLDTSKVTNFSQMFFYCNKLKTLDLSSFNTGSGQNFDSMFQGCVFLKHLDLSGFDMSSAQSETKMLSDVTRMGSITLGGKFRFTDDIAWRNPWTGASSDARWVSASTKKKYSTAELMAAYNGNPAAMAGTYVWQDESDDQTHPIEDCAITLPSEQYNYTGKQIKPVPTVTYKGVEVARSNYDVKYAENKNVGRGVVTVVGKGEFEGEGAVSFEIVQVKPKIAVKTKAKTVSAAKVRKKAVSFNMGVTTASDGKVSYTVSKKNKNIKFSKGKATLKAGKYKKGAKMSIKVKVKTAKTANCKAASRDVTLTFKVK